MGYLYAVCMSGILIPVPTQHLLCICQQFPMYTQELLFVLIRICVYSFIYQYVNVMKLKSLLSWGKVSFNVSMSWSYRQADKAGCVPVLAASMRHSEIKRFSQGKAESITKLCVLQERTYCSIPLLSAAIHPFPLSVLLLLIQNCPAHCATCL